jgi:hypothetical protein
MYLSNKLYKYNARTYLNYSLVFANDTLRITLCGEREKYQVMEFNCFVNQIRVLTLVPMLFSSYKLIKEESTKSTGVQAKD